MKRIAFLAFFVYLNLFAQQHFQYTSNTGNNATVIVPQSIMPQIGDENIGPGDEIGAFTPAGLCVGAVVWNNSNTTITVWGDNQQTSEIDGMRAGEKIYFRLYQKSTDREFENVEFTIESDSVYSPDNIYTLTKLLGKLHFSHIRNTGNNATLIIPNSIPLTNNNESILKGYEIGAFSPLGICVGAGIWKGENMAITIWGDNSQTPEIDGIQNGDNIIIKIFDFIRNEENTAIATYSLGDGIYNPDAIFQLSSLHAYGTPEPVELIYPLDQQSGIIPPVNFVWSNSANAVYYVINISTDPEFNTSAVNDTIQGDTSYTVANFFPYNVYYWKVKAINPVSESDWSSIYSFKTLGMPNKTELLLPQNFDENLPINITFKWKEPAEQKKNLNGYNEILNIQRYYFELTEDTLSLPLIADSSLTDTTKTVNELNNDTKYFWRVAAKNEVGWGAFSDWWQFTTIIDTPDVPIAFYPTNNIEVNSLPIMFKWHLSLRAENYNLQISTDSNFTNVLHDISDIQDTIYSFNNLIEDGVIYWRVNAANQGGVSEWSDKQQFIFKRKVVQSIPLSSGWNMISSYVQPENTKIDSIMDGVLVNLTLMKNNLGLVFLPEYGINSIQNWEYDQGYKIYMKGDDTLEIEGDKIDPESNPIILNNGWNMFAYLLDSEEDISAVLSDIATNIVIVRDIFGNVYLPGWNLDNIGSLKPGYGYKAYLLAEDTLIYKSNNSLPKNKKVGNNSTKHYSVAFDKTGNNETLILEIDGYPQDSEILVKDNSGNCVGCGRLNNGIAAVTVWGDDELTENIKEGPIEGEPLSLIVWNSENNREEELFPDKTMDLLTNKIVKSLTYSKDGLLLVHLSKVIPDKFDLYQNYPNPFNPETVITFSIPLTSQIKLTVFNSIGEEVKTLINGEFQPGIYNVKFEGQSLASGVYFYSLITPQSSIVKKMILLK